MHAAEERKARSRFQASRARQLLLWLCALKVAIVVLAIDPAGVVAFQLPKALASRAFEWPIAATLAYAFFAYGRRVLPRSRLHVLVTAFLAVSMLSAAFAADRYLAVFGDPENYLGLIYLFDMVLMYVALSVAVRDEHDAVPILLAIVGAGTVAIAYGAAQAAGLDPFTWAVDPRGRPFATFGNPDHFGHFLSVLFGLVLGAGLAVTEPRTRALAAAGFLASLAMAAVVATRGTVIGIAAATGGMVVLVRPVRRPLLLGAATVALLGAALALTPLGQRTIGTIGAGLPDRVLLYDIAVRASLARPILGYGPDNFRVAHAEHRTVASLVLGAGPESTAHDWLLDASTTTGILGLVVLLSLVVLGTIELWRLARAAPRAGAPLALGWLAYWAHALVAAESMATIWFPWVALGVVVGLRGTRVPEPKARHLPGLVAVVLGAAAIAGALTGARALQANRDAWTSERATHFGDTAAATEFADRAAARDGGRADNWNRLGLALEAEQRWAPANDAYREATRRAPYEAVYWANLARGLARTAGTSSAARDESIAAAVQATLVDPTAPVGHVTLAEIATVFGRCELARTEAARAAALEPGHDDLLKRAAACR